MAEKTQKGALVCAPELIFDVQAVEGKLALVCDQSVAISKRRGLLRDTLKDAWAQGHETVCAAFLKQPKNTRQTIRSFTYLAEKLLETLMRYVTGQLYPLVAPTASERLSLMFVGGSGRSEMAPYSDVDLLFLMPYKTTPWGEDVVETMLHILWDLNLKIGYSVRSIDECLTQAKADITIRTNLLEGRHVCGDENLATEFEQRLWDELISKTGPEFVEAKLAERELRHEKNGGGIRYMVEPNVKEGKGGLRDMQTLYWIAKYLYRAKSVTDLVRQKVFSRKEHRDFMEAETFLWMTRCMLHIKSGRASEKLSFDAQVEIANALGYEDEPGRRAVEKFMQDYFTHARHVGELTRVFLVQLEAEHVKTQPSIGNRLRRAFGFKRDETGEGFEERLGRIAIADPDSFFDDPVNILRLFEEALRTELMIHPEAMRQIASNLHLIDDDMRKDRAANDVFLELLTGNSNPERALRRMNELGVLGAFMPEFANIVAMMQFNMYHSYTVDEHTIQCISVLSQIERGDLEEDLPVASSILQGGINRRVLFVALLLHDIGKGRPEDHSVIGAEIAAEICPRLGMPPEEVDTVVWLVRNHLVMSDVAQKRDISDERTVHDFAEAMRTTSNLKLLTVLTVCDIRGVGPNTWNNWKAVLIRQLYASAMDHLLQGTDTQTGSRGERVIEAQNEFRRHARHLEGDAMTHEIERHYPPFWLGVDLKTQIILSKLSQNLSDTDVAQDIKMDKSRDATRACFAMTDHPGIFSRMTGALALSGANIKDARTYTSSDGVATSVFWIQDGEGNPYEKGRLGRLRKSVDDALQFRKNPGPALAEKDVPKKRVRVVTVATTITIDNNASDTYTLIEVDTRDRPGLLHDLSRAMTSLNLSISSAIIATYGNQAVDTFYVKNLIGLKVYDEERCKRIKTMLRAAIDQSADAADSAT